VGKEGGRTNTGCAICVGDVTIVAKNAEVKGCVAIIAREIANLGRVCKARAHHGS